jgi:trehalose 6-phosphate phosphatase
MRYLLSIESRPLLERLASSKTLLAFDFDGTLVPITHHPNLARLTPDTFHLLMQLTRLYPCAVLSGRSRADLAGRLEGLPFHSLLGNHGAEALDAAPPDRALIEAWSQRLTGTLGSLPGVWVEDKGFSLAVHYRQSPEPSAAHRSILLAAESLPDAHIFGGKSVINICLRSAPHKGNALATERARLHCDWALFVGDDDNDESAFALEGNVIGVRIGRKQSSAARYFLRRQAETDLLLERLIHLRQNHLGQSIQPSLPAPTWDGI